MTWGPETQQFNLNLSAAGVSRHQIGDESCLAQIDDFEASFEHPLAAKLRPSKQQFFDECIFFDLNLRLNGLKFSLFAVQFEKGSIVVLDGDLGAHPPALAFE